MMINNDADDDGDDGDDDDHNWRVLVVVVEPG